MNGDLRAYLEKIAELASKRCSEADVKWEDSGRTNERLQLIASREATLASAAHAVLAARED
jgi:hypothetical protein